MWDKLTAEEREALHLSCRIVTDLYHSTDNALKRVMIWAEIKEEQGLVFHLIHGADHLNYKQLEKLIRIAVHPVVTYTCSAFQKHRALTMSEKNSILEAMKSSPPKTFKLFRATEDNPQVEQSMSNMDTVASKIQHARSANCLIEVISLRLQFIDVWLRIYFSNTEQTEKREREFGRLLKQCFKAGLDKDLYDLILQFNKHRVDAIHGYLIGVTSYEVLSRVIDESDGLAERLAEFVLLNCGEFVDHNFAISLPRRGDAIYHIPGMLDKLRAPPRI
ncbi:hypothetical protein [Pseudomonas sp. GZD-222]|uniref:hypothetical protein n=1 Tax=Pseudomonas sp. GZD-222 TaxID=3404805 RepID=UPI003BB514A8